MLQWNKESDKEDVKKIDRRIPKGERKALRLAKYESVKKGGMKCLNLWNILQMRETTEQSITSTKAKNGISAVSTLERIYDKYGQAVLDRTLRLAAATWEGENNSFSGNILMGIARIVVAYGDTVRDDVFKDHVGRVSVKAIIRAAKERRPGALGYSEAMIIEYNKKSKFRLSLKTLYGGKAMSGEDDFGEE